jgi:polysaccharide deacetylase family protein (PEP-CTERM system associated)
MNIFTVDVEEWFHVCGANDALHARHWDQLPSRVVPTTRRLLDLLDQACVRAAFFVVGWIAARYPALVGEIQAAGHEVGSHSYWHRRVYELSPPEFADDLASSIHALQAAGAPRPIAYRAPEWSMSDDAPWALEELVRQQFEMDASMAPLKIVGRVTYPRHPHVLTTSVGNLVELPPFVADRFGHVMPLGWGWGLRMSSPRRVLASMARANASGTPAILTVHPWEIDPDPPRVRLRPRQHFAHYFRLSGFEARLKHIVSEAPFSTLSATAKCVRTY